MGAAPDSPHWNCWFSMAQAHPAHPLTLSKSPSSLAFSLDVGLEGLDQ